MALFHSQQTLYEVHISTAYHSVLTQSTLTLGRFFGENVAFERFLESDFTATGHFKALLGAAVGFNLWHSIITV